MDRAIEHEHGITAAGRNVSQFQFHSIDKIIIILFIVFDFIVTL